MSLFRLLLPAILGLHVALPSLARDRDYIGSAACTTCHEAKAAAWRRSHHAKA